MDANNKQVHVDSIDEEIVARVAAIDVAKDSGMVCTRVPHQSQPGKRTTTVWSVSARTSSIIELADRLAEERIERVVLEATSDYWRPFYYLLASAGPGGVGGQPPRRGRTGVSGRGRPSRRNHRSRASRRPGDHRRGRTVHGDLPTAAHLVSWAKLLSLI